MNAFNCDIKTALAIESDRVISEIKKINNEISIYQIYLQRFPTLSEIIRNLVKIKEKEIGLLKCELTAIKNMIEAF
ncbi:hypothetical protein ACG94M_21520 [Acinetobacter guillouiae]|uniref:hypothetical protein n=1 Tax=Acinetobacter guillouiae TaxID=106649 RepID=UPI003AF69771